jgi:cbb3-type cytochrome oxidase subunit 3
LINNCISTTWVEEAGNFTLSMILSPLSKVEQGVLSEIRFLKNSVVNETHAVESRIVASVANIEKNMVDVISGVENDIASVMSVLRQAEGSFETQMSIALNQVSDEISTIESSVENRVMLLEKAFIAESSSLHERILAMENNILLGITSLLQPMEEKLATVEQTATDDIKYITEKVESLVKLVEQYFKYLIGGVAVIILSIIISHMYQTFLALSSLYTVVFSSMICFAVSWYNVTMIICRLFYITLCYTKENKSSISEETKLLKSP